MTEPVGDGLIILTFFISILLSWLFTSRVRRYALKKDLLDIPNARSSHSVPTPRGGGLSIIIVLLISTVVSLFLPAAPVQLLVSLVLATLAYAVLGWQDDKHDLPAPIRFLFQLLIAAIFIEWLVWNRMLDFTLSSGGIVVILFSVLWIVWMANLYNFMDGIDGISAVETIMLGTVTSFWFAMSGANSIAIICIAVAGAGLGFLRWNWSPAKIFMGDVGSLALGAFFAIIALIGSSILNIPFIAFLILYAVYLADSGVTLLYRMIKRERWWQAHRSHFYQRAVQSGYSHAQVSLAVMVINLLLAVLASLVVAGVLDANIALLASLIILAPLMFLINSRFNRICRK
ncbi:putative undecaprenyl-phosphate N-acetylglucosaminyl 1-phosphate transferase [bacterium BMS3Bbin11]|nr:putative undecaprenyl-phosphate N-acetylglucosaminyl 1-phosphate transferase [bacterium BMS3Abin11]GBE45591.1 putative undecaprenyl-phosphate N-acetylglucosaminyl 1-phosphate transferase [bacterium BMS3Bbin11]GMT40051.1 MAG: glycosyl transferase [bacterium]